MRRLNLSWLLIAAALLLIGCDYADRPRRGLPEHFKAESLTGETIDRDTLKGRPWVINVWVPN